MQLFPLLTDENKHHFISSDKVTPFAVEHNDQEYLSGYLLFGENIPLRDLMIKPFFGDDPNIGIALSSLKLAEVLISVKKEDVEDYIRLDLTGFYNSPFFPDVNESHRKRFIEFKVRRLNIATRSTLSGERVTIDKDHAFVNICISGLFDEQNQTLSFKESTINLADTGYDVSLAGFILKAEEIDTNRARRLK